MWMGVGEFLCYGCVVYTVPSIHCFDLGNQTIASPFKITIFCYTPRHNHSTGLLVTADRLAMDDLISNLILCNTLTNQLQCHSTDRGQLTSRECTHYLRVANERKKEERSTNLTMTAFYILTRPYTYSSTLKILNYTRA